MTKHASGYVPNPDYSRQDWDTVSDNPAWTEDDARTAKPIEDVLPALAAAARKARGPQRAPTKELISVRLDHRVLEHYRATGPGWQSRINAALLKATGLD